MKQIAIKSCDIVTVYDPARTRESEYGRLARSAIMTTACDQDYNVYILDYFAARASFEIIYETICFHAATYHPRVIGVEDVATQIAIADAFSLLATREGIRLPPLESLKPDSRINKKWRIKSIIQRFGPYGKLYAKEDAYEFKAEFGSFPTGRTVDLLDVYAYCLMLHNIPDSVFVNNYNQRIADARGYSMRGDNIYDIEEEREKRYAMPGPPENGLRINRYA